MDNVKARKTLFGPPLASLPLSGEIRSLGNFLHMDLEMSQGLCFGSVTSLNEVMG